MEHLSLQTFKNKIFNYEESKDWKFKGARPVIIDFYADWCGPCRALAPILEEVAEKYQGRVDIFKVNTEVEPELSALFAVRSIPAILFVPLDGEPSMAHGLMPLESFEKAIEDLFALKA